MNYSLDDYYDSPQDLLQRKLTSALYDKNLDAVREAIDLGANPSLHAIYAGFLESHFCFLKPRPYGADGQVSEADLSIAQLLIQHGCVPVQHTLTGQSIFHMAAEGHHEDLLAFLIDQFPGHPYLNEPNFSLGLTPLHLSAKPHETHIPDLKAASLLLKHGANPLAQNDAGQTPSAYAASLSSTECAELLLATEEAELMNQLFRQKAQAPFDIRGATHDEAYGKNQGEEHEKSHEEKTSVASPSRSSSPDSLDALPKASSGAQAIFQDPSYIPSRFRPKPMPPWAMPEVSNLDDKDPSHGLGSDLVQQAESKLALTDTESPRTESAPVRIRHSL